MADNKKYYYLKLKDNFFESDEMIILESMPDGYVYSNILLKLYLRSLKNDGRLMFNDRIPFNTNMLAQVARHSVGDIERAMKIFQELELIEVLDNGAIYLADIQNYIGHSSTEADRKRAYRARISAEQKQLLMKSGQMSGQMSAECPDKYPPEREIEREIDTQPEKSKKKKADKEPILILGSQENVKLTDKELGRLKKEYPNDIDEAIEYLSLWIVDKGDKSKAATHNATIRRWVIKAVQEQKERMNYKKQSPLQDELRSWGINE